MPAPRTTTARQAAYELPVVTSKDPEWSHEECAAYEAARECITELIAHRNAWIYQEEAKFSPDKSAIDQWERQAQGFVEEMRGLALKDHERIAHIRRVYGAECRRLMADPDARA